MHALNHEHLINQFVDGSFWSWILDIIKMLDTEKLCKQNMTVSVLVSDFQGMMSNSSQIPNALTNGTGLTLIMEPKGRTQNSGTLGLHYWFFFFKLNIYTLVLL